MVITTGYSYVEVNPQEISSTTNPEVRLEFYYKKKLQAFEYPC